MGINAVSKNHTGSVAAARGTWNEPKAKPERAQSISRFVDRAILHHSTRDYDRWSAHDFIAEVISEISSLLTKTYKA